MISEVEIFRAAIEIAKTKEFHDTGCAMRWSRQEACAAAVDIAHRIWMESFKVCDADRQEVLALSGNQ